MSQNKTPAIRMALDLNLKSLMKYALAHFILCFSVALPAVAEEGRAVWNLESDQDSIVARAQLMMNPEVTSIDVATYDLTTDQAGMALLAGLLRAAQNGAKVRLLVNGGIGKAPAGLSAYLAQNNIELRFHKPWIPKLKDLLHPFQLLQKTNARLHDKIFLVDNQFFIVGDKNYANQYFYHSKQNQKNQMTMVGKEFLFQNKLDATKMKTYFEQIWSEDFSVPQASTAPEKKKLPDGQLNSFKSQFLPYQTWLEKLVEKSGLRIRNMAIDYDQFELLHDQLDEDGKRKSTLTQILEMLEKAPYNSRIYIEQAYFVLFPHLIQTLQSLKNKNAEVHLLLNAPPVADLKIIGEMLKIDLAKILDLGVKVHLQTSKRRASHGKLIVINESLINGSTNMDPRSYQLNSEVSVKIHSPSLANQIWRKFQRIEPFLKRVYPSNACEGIFRASYPLPVTPAYHPRNMLRIIRSQI